jgi:hypothetical protein
MDAIFKINRDFMKKEVLRELTRENGDVDAALMINRKLNKEKIKELKKEPTLEK